MKLSYKLAKCTAHVFSMDSNHSKDKHMCCMPKVMDHSHSTMLLHSMVIFYVMPFIILQSFKKQLSIENQTLKSSHHVPI